MTSDIDIWEHRNDLAIYIRSRVQAVGDALLLVVSLVILLLVILKYKRRDLFLLEIPILFLMRGLIQQPINYMVLEDIKLSWLNIVASVSYCYRFGHWLFSSQYLQTSIIFPKLFIAAQFELDSEKQLEMNQHSSGLSIKNYLDSFADCDQIIALHNDSVKRIKCLI